MTGTFTPQQLVEIAYAAAGAAAAVFARELDVSPGLDDQATAAVRDVLAEYGVSDSAPPFTVGGAG